MEAELKALKVADLKEILKNNNLDQAGKKDELVARLVEAGINADGKKAGAAPAAAAAPAPAAAKPAAATTTTTTTTTTPAAAAAAATTPAATAAATPAAAAPVAGDAAATPAAGGDAEMNELERKKARAAKFGIPFDEAAEKDKKAARAAKFGTADAEGDSKKKNREERFKGELTQAGQKQGRPAAEAMTPEEIERIKKRAQRFGVSLEEKPAAAKGGKGVKEAVKKEEPATTDPKLQARAARFAAQQAASS